MSQLFVAIIYATTLACNDDPNYNCFDNAWDWGCNTDHDIPMRCPLTCSQRYPSKTCEEFAGIEGGYDPSESPISTTIPSCFDVLSDCETKAYDWDCANNTAIQVGCPKKCSERFPVLSCEEYKAKGGYSAGPSPDGVCHSLVSWVSDTACQSCSYSVYYPCDNRIRCTDECFISITSTSTTTNIANTNTTTTTTTTTTTSTTGTTRTTTTTSTTRTTTTTPLAPFPENNPLLKSILEHLNVAKYDFLKSQQPNLSWAPSKLYKKNDLISAVRKAIETGVGSLHLYDGSDMGIENGYKYALTNIAAFLGQAMQETIRYDACDENNWDWESYAGGEYRTASACGQLGQSYGDYKCPAGQEHMACEVDPNMELVATTHAKWHGAPPPLFCGPASKLPIAPKWNYGGWCNTLVEHKVAKTFDEIVANIKSGNTCGEYAGQQAGYFVRCSNASDCAANPAPNFGIHHKRPNVEGCCWWGRGVIQTTGVCNFGKLNYYIGARAHREGRKALFPDVDFCKRPDKICSDPLYRDLKWFAGLFYYMSDVQTYSTPGWDYLTELKKFVDSGFNNGLIFDSGFIHGVSGIVNRGCHNPPACGTGELHAGIERAKNFKAVLKAFGLI